MLMLEFLTDKLKKLAWPTCAAIQRCIAERTNAAPVYPDGKLASGRREPLREMLMLEFLTEVANGHVETHKIASQL